MPPCVGGFSAPLSMGVICVLTSLHGCVLFASGLNRSHTMKGLIRFVRCIKR